MNWETWETRFAHFLTQQPSADAAHDRQHIHRVVRNARQFAAEEAADLAVVLPAAWLHDCVSVPKDSPQRRWASQLAAETAVHFLHTIHYPPHYLEAIAHAIAAHSFSAKIVPQTLEAQVVQDADRIDALGAVGIARAFITGGSLGRPLYHPHDPFCHQRPADDGLASVDHFYTKLLHLADTMQTTAARREAQARTQFMREYLHQLAHEIGVPINASPPDHPPQAS